MYAKIQDNKVTAYPITFSQIQQTFPNVSFPTSPTDGDLAGTGFVNVVGAHAPTTDSNKKAVETTPTIIGGMWVQTYNIVDKTPAELASDLSTAETVARSVRDNLLSASDYTQMPDYNLSTKTAWAEYRQQLRDITTHSNWPNLDQADWPKKPS